MRHNVMASLLVLAALAPACTSLLGVEEGELVAGSGGAASTSSSGLASSSPSAVSTGSSAPTAASSTTGAGAGPASSSGETVSVASSSDATSGEGGATTSGDGGAGAGTTSGSGGQGGETISSSSSTTTGGDGGAGGEGTGGEGGGCDSPALPICPGAQPNPFMGPADLDDHWDVLANEAKVDMMRLRLKAKNGSNGARIQAEHPLEDPTDCAVWIKLVTPSANANLETGLAIATSGDTYSLFHLAGELRARDAGGALAIVTPPNAATMRLRARFDASGGLWLDYSPDGVCWTAIDGPFDVSGDLEVQLYTARPNANGEAVSFVDDYCR